MLRKKRTIEQVYGEKCECKNLGFSGLHFPVSGMMIIVHAAGLLQVTIEVDRESSC